jgi:hypothetical protein
LLRRDAWLAGLLAAVIILGAMLVLAGTALPRELDHDEHQFVASGVLLTRSGLLPYIDYPTFTYPIWSFSTRRLTFSPPVRSWPRD